MPVSVATALLHEVDADRVPAVLPPQQGPSTQAMRDELSSALASAAANRDAPKPSFDTAQARLAYLRWLSEENRRLTAYTTDHIPRVELLETAYYEARRAGLDPALVLGVIDVLSQFRKYRINESGARGYMQVAAHWAKDIGDGDTLKLFHMQSNLRFGCALLRHYLDESNGNLHDALLAYFAQSKGRNVDPNDRTAEQFAQAVLDARNLWLVGG